MTDSTTPQLLTRPFRELLIQHHPEGILQAILSVAKQQTAADQVSMVLIDRVTGRLTCQTTPPPTDPPCHRHFHGQSLTREILSTASLVTISDVLTDQRCDSSFIQSGVRSFTALPIPGDDGLTTGVLYIYSRKPAAFDSSSVGTLLHALADQTGLALENAKTYAEMDVHARYLEALVTAGNGFARARSFSEALNWAADFLQDQFQISTFFIGIYDGVRDEIVFPLAVDRGTHVEIPARILGSEPAGWNVSGFVVRTGKELYWSTLEEGQTLLSNAGIQIQYSGEPPKPQTCFYLPLKSAEGCMGVISIQAFQPYAFDSLLMDACRALASQFSVDIENVRLFETAQEASRQLSVLNRVTLEIASECDRPVLLRKIIRQAIRLLNAEGGGVYLLAPTCDYFTLQVAEGLPMEMEGQHTGLSAGINALIFQSGKPQKVNDYSNWIDRQPMLNDIQISSVAGAPICVSDHFLGTLVVHDLDEGRIFNDKDLALLQQFANHAGLAIQKVELISKLQSLQTISTTITSSLDLIEVLNHTCQAAVELFGVDHSGLVLFDSSLEWGEVRGSFPPDPTRNSHRIPVRGIPAEERLVHDGEPLVIPDIEGAANDLGSVADILRADHIRALLVVPIRYQGNVLGSFSLDSFEHPRSFTPEEIDLCRAFADQVAVAVENARLYEEASHRRDLLAALDEASRHIRAIKSTPKLMHEIVRLAGQLVGCSAGVLYLNRPHLNQLETIDVWGLPDTLLGQVSLKGDGLAGRVAQTGQAEVWAPTYIDALLSNNGLKSAAAVPLREVGEVEAVLVVASPHPGQTFTTADLEVLRRFAEQASIAMQTSRLVGREQRRLTQMIILHEISDAVQAANDLNKILHVMLTGVTAGYGLGFNRAALFLLDERRHHLVGRMGIGHLNEITARRDWSHHIANGLEDFHVYLHLLDENKLQLTPIGENIEGLKLEYTPEGCGYFYHILDDLGCTTLSASEIESLPVVFREAFEPSQPMVAVRLTARGQVIGLLVADNKFTQNLITPEDEEALMTFVNTAAVGIENAQLIAENRKGSESLRSFYTASNALVSSHDLERVLHDIVEGARQTSHASGVTLIMMSTDGHPLSFVPTGTDAPLISRDFIRKDGVSMEVMRTGKPQTVEDTSTANTRANPSMRTRGIKSALCIPVSVQGVRIGVMWFHFPIVRYFTDAEIEAAQFYVNQAALAYDSAHRIKELENLRSAAEALAGKERLDDVLRQIVLSARNVLDANSAVIWVYDDVHDKFVLDQSISSGISKSLWQELLDKKPNLEHTAGIVIQKGWLGITDISNEEKVPFLDSSTRCYLQKIGARSFQSVVLRVGDIVLGVLYVHYNQSRDFREEEQKIARTFANHAALALQNARLLEQVRKARDAARVVARVSTLEDVNKTLNSIAQASLNTLDCNAVTLYRYDAVKDAFFFPPAMAGVMDKESVLLLGEVTQHSVVHNILNLDHMYITENAQNDTVMAGRFVEREGIYSSVGIPLAVGEQKVGVMFVNYRSVHHFTAGEIANLELFSNQAAVAIRNAQLYQMEQHDKKVLLAIQETSSAVSSVLQLDVLLPMITERAAQIFDTPATSLMLWDETDEALMIYAAHGLSKSYRDQQRIPRKQVMKLARKNGMCVQSIDLTQNSVGDPNLVTAEGLTVVLTAPLKTPDALLGMLNIYKKSGARSFSEKDMELANIFANHAAIAIKNAQDYAELRRSRGLVGTRTALAWMGMVSNVWMHTLEKKTIVLREDVERLRRQIERGDLDIEKLEGPLARMERITNEISTVPITSPDKEDVYTLSLDEIVQERLDQLWKNEPYRSVILEYEFTLGFKGSVRTSAVWLCHALDIVLDNAVEATRCRERREINVSTALNGSRAEILIHDNGQGISPDRLPHLFHEPTPKRKNEPGMGMGLLMARTILNAYNGDVDVRETDTTGTTMVLWLPIES